MPLAFPNPGINNILKDIKIENGYFNIVMFHNIIVLIDYLIK